MLELRLAGVHDDGENLVLESADGTAYLLPIDQNLRTSIAKARRIQPLRNRGGSGSFGPRDIQARFRQGASVEEIVAESGWDADRVRKYEWPIIAERHHIISAARNAGIIDFSTRGASTTARADNLNQRLERVLQARGLEELEQTWGAFQQESGQWTISLDLPLGSADKDRLPGELTLPARWTYNPANQGIYASNDAAYFFMDRAGGQEETPEAEPASPAEQAEVANDEASETEHVDFARHADDPQVFPEESSLKQVRVPRDETQEEILDELETRRGIRDYGSAAERKLADLLERARRSGGQQQAEAPAATGQAQDDVPVIGDERPAETSQQEESTSALEDQPLQEEAAAEHVKDAESIQQVEEAAAEQAEEVDASEAAESQKVAASQEDVPEEPEKASPPEEAAEQAEKDEQAAKAEQTQRSNRPSKSKRASVPSWDDIIFGSQRK